MNGSEKNIRIPSDGGIIIFNNNIITINSNNSFLNIA